MVVYSVDPLSVQLLIQELFARMPALPQATALLAFSSRSGFTSCFFPLRPVVADRGSSCSLTYPQTRTERFCLCGMHPDDVLNTCWAIAY